jgi:hypothetical protein
MVARSHLADATAAGSVLIFGATSLQASSYAANIILRASGSNEVVRPIWRGCMTQVPRSRIGNVDNTLREAGRLSGGTLSQLPKTSVLPQEGADGFLHKPPALGFTRSLKIRRSVWSPSGHASVSKSDVIYALAGAPDL